MNIILFNSDFGETKPKDQGETMDYNLVSEAIQHEGAPAIII
jgi:hypothetical protein